MARNNELIRLAKKAADAWRNTDTYHQAAQIIDMLVEELEMPTLTPPNEPLTLLSMSDELPPDNERVLVYRSCMVDSNIGPYSVQWGWAAKRDGSHWARLPNRRPPEGEEGDVNRG